ncbi:MAG: hypothetical protein QOI63_314 [Thermoplasmata archaeon]|jgi:hypothetical protein|nr:hypothetical protein [Thermoplasmata archaeon]
MGADLPSSRLLFQEAKDLLERGLSIGGRIDDKAANLVTFNAVVLGLLATAFTLAAPARPKGWSLAGLFPGPLFLFASMLCAVRAYRPTEYAAGLSSPTIQAALANETKEKDLLGAAIHAYGQAFELNAARLRRRTLWVRRSVLLLAAGLVLSTGSAAFIIFVDPWGIA